MLDIIMRPDDYPHEVGEKPDLFSSMNSARFSYFIVQEQSIK